MYKGDKDSATHIHMHIYIHTYKHTYHEEESESEAVSDDQYVAMLEGRKLLPIPIR